MLRITLMQVQPQFLYPPDVQKMVTPLVNIDSYIHQDIAWMLSRLEHLENQKIPAWTGFHQIVSQVGYRQTRLFMQWNKMSFG